MKLNKTQKVVRWASEHRVRNVAHAMEELGYENEKALRFHLSRLVRKGLIKFEQVGRQVELGLTQEAYYNRAQVVIAR